MIEKYYKNKVEEIIIVEALTYEEKGEILYNLVKSSGKSINQFCKDIGKEKERRQINRYITAYTGYANEKEEVKEQLNRVKGDGIRRLLMRIQPPNKAKKIKFIIDNRHGFIISELSKIVSVMNNSKEITEVEKEIKEYYEKKMAFIKKFKREFFLEDKLIVKVKNG